MKTKVKKSAEKKQAPNKVSLAGLKPTDVLNRKQASSALGISIYAVDQALLKKQLKDLVFSNVTKFGKTLKAA